MIARHLRTLVGVTGVVILVVFGVRLVQGLTTDYSGDARLARRDVPGAPAAAPPVGTYIESTLTDDGEVDVRQWVRSATPLDSLTLRMADPDGQQGETPTAGGIEVIAADGTELARADAIDETQVTLPLRTAVTELYLSYTISGGTTADETSTVPGRSLLGVSAMDVSWPDEDGPSVRLLSGPGTILNAACLEPAAAASLSPRACGAPAAGGGWEVTLHGVHAHDHVFAQLQVDPA